MIAPFQYDDLIGVPYLHGGRGNGGLDCWGAIIILKARQGIVIPDPYKGVEKLWGRHATPEEAEAAAARLFGNYEKLEQPNIGCIVTFSRWGNAPDHAGILVEPGKFIHSVEKIGVCISKLARQPWCDWYRGAYHYRGN